MKTVILGYEDETGNLEAALPLLPTRGLPFDVGAQQTGPRLACLPRTPAAGPVFIHEAAAVALLQAAVKKARSMGGLQLQVKCERLLPVDQVEELFCVNWRPTYVLAIPERKEGLRFGDAGHRHKLKWAVKKAEENGLQIRTSEDVEELRSWYPLYLQTMRRNAVPPRPLRFFLALWEGMFHRGMMQLKLAEQHAGSRRRLLAGSIFLRFRDTVWYAFTGAADEELRLHPNDLILWQCIHENCGSGVRWMDLGEVPEEHPELARFKTKWDARPRAQYRYYSRPQAGTTTRAGLKSHRAKAFLKLWQRVPLCLTAWLGDWIYRQL